MQNSIGESSLNKLQKIDAANDIATIQFCLTFGPILVDRHLLNAPWFGDTSTSLIDIFATQFVKM